jgi:hypothetical protein
VDYEKMLNSQTLTIVQFIILLTADADNSLFFAKKDLSIKRNIEQYKVLQTKENYKKNLEMSFVFNLQTVSTARRRCCSSLSQPDVL